MDKQVLIRTITALVVAIIDLASYLGIKINADQDAVMTLVTVAVGIWIWWKDNPVTTEAKATNKIMNELKSNRLKSMDDCEEPEDSEVR